MELENTTNMYRERVLSELDWLAHAQKGQGNTVAYLAILDAINSVRNIY